MKSCVTAMNAMNALPRNARKRWTRGSDRASRWIALPWIALAPWAAACGAEAPGSEPTASTASAIYAGTLDDDAQQNASVVALEIAQPAPDGGTQLTLCSGSLIAANVVLTARHCVSTQLSTTLQCDQNGNSLSGANFGDDLPAGNVHVMVGPGIYQNETPAANGKAIFHGSGTTECNQDVALVVLDQPITTIAPMRVRVAKGVTTGETVRAVGFGQNDQSKPIGTRFRKDGLAVLAVGSTVSASQTPLGSNEFELGESTCGGDSGGPAIDETTGAIVGVMSRAYSDCTLNYGHTFMALEGFQSVFQQAFAAAGGSYYDESGPQPTVDGGASSSSGAGSGGGGSSGSGGSSSSGSGGSGGSGGSTHYGGGYNLQSGKGAACSAAAVGQGGTWSGIALAGLGGLFVALARRRAARRRLVLR
jgi:hypothetical protein